MPWKILNRRACLNLLGALILVLGLGSAGMVYHGGGNSADDILGYEESGGTNYPLRPEDSKDYLRNMELYGGKANVLADKLRRLFLGLWQGKSLAIIIGSVSLITSWGFFHEANAAPKHLNRANPIDDYCSKKEDQ
jgi:hypothetical protein